MQVTDLKIQKNNDQRCNLFIDGEFCCGITAETAVYFHIKKGMELSQEELEEILQRDSYSSALDIALGYASRTANKSKRDFADRLSDYPPEVVDMVLIRLEELGYINDELLATDIVKHSLAKNEGPLLIRQRLTNRRVDRLMAQKAMDSVDYDDFISAAKKCGEEAIRKYGFEDAKSRAKVYAAMQRRGFSYDMITEALGEVED